MQLKNVNLFEKYVEKVVLGIAAVFALFVLWFYALSNPYAVTFGPRKDTVQPDDVERLILKEAETLSRKISDSAPSPFKGMTLTVPPYTNEFWTRYSRHVLPVPAFTAIMGLPGLNAREFQIAEPLERNPYFVPMPPAPIALKTGIGFGVLTDPPDPMRLRSFEAIIGDQKPRDFQWISVSAEFDLNTWRTRLVAKPPEANRQQIPEPWWRNVLLVADVVLQRQVKDPATGQWGPIETVPPVPGNEEIEFLPKLSVNYRRPVEKWAPPEAKAALETARAERVRLARPPFPSLDQGIWLPPEANPALMAPGDAEKLQALVNDIRKFQEQIKQLRKDGAGERPAIVTPTRTRTSGPASPGTPGSPGSPGTSGTPASPGNPATPAPAGRGAPAAEEAIDESKLPLDLPGLEARLQSRTSELYRLLGIHDVDVSLVQQGTDSVMPIHGNTSGSPGSPGESPRDMPNLGTVKIWQHDISVKPGQSIRYRVIASVIDPLFYQSQVPALQRREFYEKLTLSSEPSEWTEPVQIFPEQYFFLTTGNKQNKSATVEVYCIFGGKMQSHEFQVQPGDPIGGVVEKTYNEGKSNVNMNVGGIVVDIDYDAPAPGGLPNKTTTRMIYLDNNTGALMERTVDEDKANPKHNELREQVRASS
ncbi:MAG: hypothetical protein IT440_04770 [Phycisphaeraceae bacterium]|nr:hypothetical protein [Phycisphaeraceae bacterium]